MSKLDMSIIGKKAYYTLRGLNECDVKIESPLEDEVVEILDYSLSTKRFSGIGYRNLVIVRCIDRKMDEYVNDELDGDNGVFFAYVSQLDIIEEE